MLASHAALPRPSSEGTSMHRLTDRLQRHRYLGIAVLVMLASLNSCWGGH
jgi:hypothetical protein